MMRGGLNVNQFAVLRRKLIQAFVLVVGFSTPFFSIYADERAIELLNRMNRALHQLSYTGTLAYLRGNTLSTLHIEHLVNNGIESERVVRLNEAGSEVSRELKGFSLASIPKIRAEMLKVYSFDMGRRNRVANIPCTIITARPKDRARYLQKYCIDTSTGMLLDYMLVGKSHKPVEQFMFTTINIQAPPKAALEEQAENQDAINNNDVVRQGAAKVTQVVKKATLSNANRMSKPQALKKRDLDDGWVMEALPRGYEVNRAPHLETETSNSQGVTKHYIVSDGLSALSVFVSPLTDETPLHAVKINSGALNIVTQKKQGYLITVVGEVPETTLKNIINSIRKK